MGTPGLRSAEFQEFDTLVLFDGECALCNGWVRFFLPRDRLGRIRFAPLQGETGRGVIARHGLEKDPLRSVVLVEQAEGGERVFLRSEAALRAFAKLGWPWKMVSWLRVIPAALRDVVYDFIAQRRYGWFGTVKECVVNDRRFTGRILL